MSQQDIEAVVPFVATLGVSFTRLDPAEVVAELPAGRSLSTINGGLHGGASMALADMAATVCATLNAPEGTGTTTAQCSTYFLRPLREHARAVARPLRVGARLIVVEVDVVDAEGTPCVRMVQDQAVVGA